MAIQVNNINILEAHKRIANLIIKTPCVYEPFLSEKLQAQIYLKLENRQRTGSFKERGAVNRLLLMTQAEKRLGVVTASAGNHAQAVAYHASQQGIQSTIFMPLCAPEIKVTHTQKFGAEVHLLGEDYDEAQQAALQFAQESGAFYLHAYDDPWVIAGQGTVGLEILEQIPAVDLILCPVGGGGLISGIAVALETHPIAIIGIQSKTVPSMKQALESGGPVTLPTAQTIADGIRVRRVGKLTYEICQKLISRWV
ncbi:MAG: threonine/serine dehydratase, partial [Myxococcaceae bacterium]